MSQHRNPQAEQMADELNAAEFHGHRISERRARTLVIEANLLADYVNWLANQ